jgi:hypothetical protein
MSVHHIPSPLHYSKAWAEQEYELRKQDWFNANRQRILIHGKLNKGRKPRLIAAAEQRDAAFDLLLASTTWGYVA